MSLEKSSLASALLNGMPGLCFRMIIPLVTVVMLNGCNAPALAPEPAITITKIPPAGEPNSVSLLAINGKVSGAKPAEKIVLFAHAGVWWVQPTASRPFTDIAPDGGWKGATHPAAEYAALLVKSAYRIPAKLVALPAKGGDIVAIAKVAGAAMAPPVRTIRFSGYDWEVCDFPNDRAGTLNVWAPENVRVDTDGFLHLRVSRDGSGWKSAAVRMLRGLGYGSYRFVVQNVSNLEPSIVFTLLTWNGGTTEHEMDVEVSRWGQPANKNAQYVVQPYYVAANVTRFVAPPGVLTHSFLWQPGRVTFRTVRGSTNSSASSVVDEHTFTIGVPSPDNDFVRINLYRFESRTSPLKNGAEVTIEKFEYLP